MSLPLDIRGLDIGFGEGAETSTVVRSVDLQVAEREILALVGDSGSGKTLTARAVLDLLPANAHTSGIVTVTGTDILRATRAEVRGIRGRDAAMIFQEPSVALNPVFRIGWQMAEALRAHGITDRSEQRARCLELLTSVGIPDPERRINDYPHQFSGGQKQRIIIAMALALRPSLIIADEPTTALDVMVQAEILDLLRTCRDEHGASILLITHSMGVVADLADRVTVMFRGDIVESGTTEQIFHAPRETYTRDLLAAVPRLGAVTAPRPAVSDVQDGAALLQLDQLNVTYPAAWRKPAFVAVDNVSLRVRKGEVYGLVGESGSGKSTIGRAILGLTAASSGEILLEGVGMTGASGAALRAMRRRIGTVFQDPAASFNPFFTVAECITEPMVVHREGGNAESRRARALELLDAVQLSSSMADRHPYELSGGQRQRVGLARGLVLQPELLIADEPTSALDVSVQAQVLELFTELQREFGFGAIFISHDLAVVEMLAHEVGVLQQGRLVEQGATAAVLSNPTHPYTQRLIAAVPVPDPTEQRKRRDASQREGLHR